MDLDSNIYREVHDATSCNIRRIVTAPTQAVFAVFPLNGGMLVKLTFLVRRRSAAFSLSHYSVCTQYIASTSATGTFFHFACDIWIMVRSFDHHRFKIPRPLKWLSSRG